MEELRDEDVRLQKSVLVEFLDVFQYIDKPFIVLMSGTHPEEVNLKKKVFHLLLSITGVLFYDKN